MAKPNYAYEKRQRELAKKRKKEDKAAGRKPGGGAAEADQPESDEQPAAPDASTPTSGAAQGPGS